MIATNDTGHGNRPVRRHRHTGTRRAACARGRGAPADDGISSATAQAIQATIAQTVQGASAVRARGAGTDADPQRHSSERGAAQQAEAIARGYVGEKSTRDRRVAVLGASRSTSGCASLKSTARSPASSALTGRRWAMANAGASA